MASSKLEKYLGDLVSQTGKSRTNIESRRGKGFGLCSQILAILSEIPLGNHKIEIGLILRQAMLLNGILYNSEAWQSIPEEEIKLLEDVDNHFLRKLLQAHSKTSVAFLHLETGNLPVRFILASRRLIYYHGILSKSEDELVHRVFNAQKVNITRGDWYETITDDF